MVRKKKQSSAPSSTEPPVVKASDHRTIYTNSAQFLMSIFESRIIFCEFLNDADGQRIEQKVSVVMSPHHAKVFSRLLAENVKQYEAQMGPINIPEEPVKLLKPPLVEAK